MRARMALKISGAQYEHREVLLRDKPAEMLAVSPKATVPVLVLEGGDVLEESYDIMLWALAANDPQGWLKPGLETMTPLIETITGDFKHHLDRYKYASRYGKADRKSLDLSHRVKACETLADYEKTLGKTPYLMGINPSLTDYATFPFIRQFAAVEPDWWGTPEFPHLKKWLDGFLDSMLFKDIMHKYPVWKAE